MEISDHTIEKAAERDFAEALRTIKREQLFQRIPGFQTIVASVPPRPGPLRTRRITTVINNIRAYKESIFDDPFHPAPPERVNGPVILGTQKRNKTPIGIQPVELCGNIAVIGSTGTGKTSLVEHLLSQLDVVSPRTQQCFFDPKGDYLARAARNANTIIIHDHLPLNILIPPRFMRPEVYHALLVRRFCDAYYSAAHTTRILTDGINDGFVRYPNAPSSDHVREIIEQKGGKDWTYQTRDAKINTATRIRDLCAIFPGIAHAVPPACLTMDDLCTRPVYFPSFGMLNAYEFLFSLWVSVRHAYHQAQKIHDELHTIICADEALQIFQANTRHITNEPLLNHTIGMTREAGLAFAITLSSAKSASPVLRANLNIQAVLRLTDGIESEELRRTFRLTPEQHAYLDQRLTRGEVILRLGNRYQEPILALYPPPPPGQKEVTDDELRAAKARALNFIRPTMAESIIDPMPAANETAEAATTATAAPTRIALTKNEQAITEYLGSVGIAIVSEVGIATELRPMTFTRARRKLESVYHFIESGWVTIGSGQGKAGMALRLTAAGASWLGHAAHGMRGHSGIQHHYWCASIARALGANLEETIGTKSVDVCWSYDAARHAGFLRLLLDTAHRLTDTIAEIRDGDIMAIEIESDGTRTALNNARKNHQAGIPLTIIGVHKTLLQTWTQLKEQLETEIWNSVLLVETVWLLDTCRQLSLDKNSTE